MLYRTLGRTGIRVSSVGFGAWGIGGGWGPTDDDAALRALHAAFAAGVNLFDTAYAYGDGRSEELIGQAFRDRRGQVVIASKVPPKTFRWPTLEHEPIHDTFPADWIVECTERSLRKLGTDYLDVQQLHAWSDSYTASDEWRTAAERLKRAGKIRAFGVSANDWNPYNTVRLVESGHCDSVQVIYNLFEQRPAERLLPAALQHQVGIIVRVPFEEGLLTGALRPGHRWAAGDWRAQWLTDERLRVAEPRIVALERELDATWRDLPSLGLGFVLAHPAVSTVIPGMRSPARVAANCAVASLPTMDAAMVGRLRAHAWHHGWQYPWSQLKEATA